MAPPEPGPSYLPALAALERLPQGRLTAADFSDRRPTTLPGETVAASARAERMVEAARE